MLNIVGLLCSQRYNLRKPEIVADAAYLILNKPSRECTGNFFIDEQILIEHGITDLEKYSVVPNFELYTDFFL
ncbi:MAG: hypothetical protein HWN79_19015 [Candidatus Lokiarchaeota archaeon]|nr:hypothetical protein [Candidatus Lokiarchaeota archaeon]